MSLFVCRICGHIAFDSTPDNCPVCGALKENFMQNNDIFRESMEKSLEAEDKHKPSITIKKECGLISESCQDVFVRIGKVLHPMKKEHFIQFIDVYLDKEFVERVSFVPDSVNPAICTHFKIDSGDIAVVEHCNIHGYWYSEAML